MMAQSQTASLTIAEMREFASFTAEEQAFIASSLEVGLGRHAAVDLAARPATRSPERRRQFYAYREAIGLREVVPEEDDLDGVDEFIGPLVRIAAEDLAHGEIESFSAFRFLYERLLGAAARPFLPAIFCAAAALPCICPDLRRTLLRSLSEAAATAAGWSRSEPCFIPRTVDAAA